MCTQVATTETEQAMEARVDEIQRKLLHQFNLTPEQAHNLAHDIDNAEKEGERKTQERTQVAERIRDVFFGCSFNESEFAEIVGYVIGLDLSQPAGPTLAEIQSQYDNLKLEFRKPERGENVLWNDRFGKFRTHENPNTEACRNDYDDGEFKRLIITSVS